MEILINVLAGIIAICLFVLFAVVLIEAIRVSLMDPDEWKEQQRKIKENYDEQDD